MNLAFLHWAVDPADVAPHLPRGTEPDLDADGRTFVGLIPFEMHRAGLGRVPAPFFGSFLETNIRLYSVDAAGRHGVVFRSLDASRLAIVLLARFGIRIPYLWSSMTAETLGRVHTYRTHRRWPGPGARSEIVLEVGGPVEPTATEEFLTLRWGMHSSLGGRTIWTPNEHEAWPLHEARLLHLSDDLGTAAGFPVAGEPTLRPLWTPGVRTRFGTPSRVA
nr:DUF2071 domain-containing protein [Nakamurella flavida]